MNTEDQIKEAARRVFTKKGFAGARMQEIADEAGINKAMLHYYYRSKQKLFEVIFEESLRKLFPKFNQILQSKGGILDKIDAFVFAYIDAIRSNPHLPLFVLHELSSNPDRFIENLTHQPNLPDLMNFVMQLQNEVAEGKIQPIQPLHLLMNVLSMCAFPFVARPMLQAVAQVSDDQFDQLMQERKQVISQFVRRALTP
jgi:TetR/AcrR family transcriptional regulator